MADANVMLRIGSSVGPGGFASLEAAINMSRQLIATGYQHMEQLDQFAVVMRNVNMEMVNYADAAAKGQVDTFAIMKQMGAFAEVGLKATKEQWAALTKAADAYSDRTGKKTTEVFEQLTDSIIRGTSRGLIPFGIQLDETEDKAKAQQEALKKLTERYSGVTATIDDTTGAVFALKNSFDTTMGVIWEGVTLRGGPVKSFFEFLAEKIGHVGEELSKLNVTQRTYINNLGLSVDGLKLLHYEIIDFTRGLTDAEKTQREIAQNNILAKLTSGNVDLSGLAGKDVAEQIRKDPKLAKMFNLRVGRHEEDLSVGGMADRLAREEAERKAKEESAAMAPRTPRSGGSKAREEETPQQRADRIWGEYQKAAAQAMGGARVDFQPDLTGAGTSEMYFSEAEISGVGGGETVGTESTIGKYKAASDQIQFVMDAERERYEQEKAHHEEWLDWQDDVSNEMKTRLDEWVAEYDAQEAYYKSAEYHAQKMHENTEMMADSWGSLRSSIGVVMQAYEKGTQGMTKAAATMYYIDCIMNIVIESARAIASFAKGPAGIAEGVMHVAAAAAFGAAAAIAASHGGSSSSGSGSVSATGPSATAGQYSGGYNRADNQSVTLNITMDDSSKGLGWIVRESDRAARSGEPHFVKAA